MDGDSSSISSPFGGSNAGGAGTPPGIVAAGLITNDSPTNPATVVMPATTFPPVVSHFNVPPPGFVPLDGGAVAVAPALLVPPPISEWSAHKSPDGRTYYYNSVTKQSSWEKPDDLKTPAEKLLSSCPWKEYQSDTGKVYFHNVTTKESRWEVPPELAEIKNRILAEEAANAAKAVAAMTSSSMAGLILPGALPLIPPIIAPMINPIISSQVQSASNSPVMNSNENSSSALDQAMAATLAAIEVPDTPPKEKSPGQDDSGSNSGAGTGQEETPAEEKVEFKDKKEAQEAFKEFLKEKNIASNSSWDQCVKVLSRDPRYATFKTLNEKKQVFNAYKTQKVKDEKEETRLRAKKAKEDLEQFLMASDKMNSLMKFYKCEEVFGSLDVWRTVPEQDRRDIYEDCIFNLAKREKEEMRVLKKRNMRVLGDLLQSITTITYQTTWSEAQVMLLDNNQFKTDVNLLGMDKEDALIVFEEHIRGLEKEADEEKELEKKRLKRLHRKNRDAFLTLLDSLHEEGKLTSMSLMVELYPSISSDLRFSAMLGQSGSTPLDLFKFYVEDLKSRFHDEKKIIREILKEKEFVVQPSTTFEDFATVVCEDKRSATLDAGNVKLTYNALLEKAEAAEKERIKSNAKRIKKLENELKTVWIEAGLTPQDSWEMAQKLVVELEAYTALEGDAKVEAVWEDFVKESEDSCTHHHSRSRKSKKSKKHKKKSRSSSRSGHSDHSDVDYIESVELVKSSSSSRKKKTVAMSPIPQSPPPPPPPEVVPLSARSISVSSVESLGESTAATERKKKKKKKHKRSSPYQSPDRMRDDGHSPPPLPSDVPVTKSKKKKEKRRKDKRQRSSSPLSDDGGGGASPKVDDPGLSESELESQRALLLAQLNESPDE